MAQLDCLSIRGIRSFGDEKPEMITFSKPLTVIVGANGCGKTTIIECLKYATTGELPPGTGSGAGQSFIHDPKIAGKSEVKAQIKLKFKNRIPQTMVCVRDLQVTQARSKMSFKALDAVIMTYKFAEDGVTKEKVSITHRCSEMDRLMPDLLGVPPAVLNHVVFVHQEDANWPLAEGAVLKKRFDEIFESARYTKALVDIRTARKEKADELKQARLDQELAKRDKAAADDMRARADATGAQIASLEGEQAEAERDMLDAREVIEANRALVAAQAAQREEAGRLAMQASMQEDTARAVEKELTSMAESAGQRERDLFLRLGLGSLLKASARGGAGSSGSSSSAASGLLSAEAIDAHAESLTANARRAESDLRAQQMELARRREVHSAAAAEVASLTEMSRARLAVKTAVVGIRKEWASIFEGRRAAALDAALKAGGARIAAEGEGFSRRNANMMAEVMPPVIARLEAAVAAAAGAARGGSGPSGSPRGAGSAAVSAAGGESAAEAAQRAAAVEDQKATEARAAAKAKQDAADRELQRAREAFARARDAPELRGRSPDDVIPSLEEEAREARERLQAAEKAAAAASAGATAGAGVGAGAGAGAASGDALRDEKRRLEKEVEMKEAALAVRQASAAREAERSAAEADANGKAGGVERDLRAAAQAVSEQLAPAAGSPLAAAVARSLDAVRGWAAVRAAGGSAVGGGVAPGAAAAAADRRGLDEDEDDEAAKPLFALLAAPAALSDAVAAAAAAQAGDVKRLEAEATASARALATASRELEVQRQRVEGALSTMDSLLTRTHKLETSTLRPRLVQLGRITAEQVAQADYEAYTPIVDHQVRHAMDASNGVPPRRVVPPQLRASASFGSSAGTIGMARLGSHSSVGGGRGSLWESEAAGAGAGAGASAGGHDGGVIVIDDEHDGDTFVKAKPLPAVPVEAEIDTGMAQLLLERGLGLLRKTAAAAETTKHDTAVIEALKLMQGLMIDEKKKLLPRGGASSSAAVDIDEDPVLPGSNGRGRSAGGRARRGHHDTDADTDAAGGDAAVAAAACPVCRRVFTDAAEAEMCEASLAEELASRETSRRLAQIEVLVAEYMEKRRAKGLSEAQVEADGARHRAKLIAEADAAAGSGGAGAGAGAGASSHGKPGGKSAKSKSDEVPHWEAIVQVYTTIAEEIAPAYAKALADARAASDAFNAAEDARRSAWSSEKAARRRVDEAREKGSGTGHLLGTLSALVKRAREARAASDHLERLIEAARSAASAATTSAGAGLGGLILSAADTEAALSKPLAVVQRERDDARTALHRASERYMRASEASNAAMKTLMTAREEAAAADAALARAEAAKEALVTARSAVSDAEDAAAAARAALTSAETRFRAARAKTEELKAEAEKRRREAEKAEGDARARLDTARTWWLRLQDTAKRLLELADSSDVAADEEEEDARAAAATVSAAGAAGEAGGAVDVALARAVAEEREAREAMDEAALTIERLRDTIAAGSGSRTICAAAKRLAVARAAAAAARAERAQIEADLAAQGHAAAAASSPPDEVVRRMEKHLRRLEVKAGERGGRLTELRSLMAETTARLEQATYRNAAARLSDRIADVGTLEYAVRDLDRYHAALDTALMRYHKLKVAEINATIKDLWGNTYQGSDIDTIEIRSDLDEADAVAAAAAVGGAGAGAGAGSALAASTTASGRSRNYNYRVVMMKGDAELDMRGRCSAGQKVLASIVIRLALAESFCVSTGIMALDEPTTNLDAPNKKGLARALARIIEMRSVSNSLQLLVITHDEEFVEELGRQMHDGGGSSSKAQLGTYYRVWRQEVRPGVFASRIEKQVVSA